VQHRSTAGAGTVGAPRLAALEPSAPVPQCHKHNSAHHACHHKTRHQQKGRLHALRCELDGRFPWAIPCAAAAVAVGPSRQNREGACSDAAARHRLRTCLR